MYPHSHFIAAFTLSEIAVKSATLTHTQAFICAATAVLVDTDHYIYCILKNHTLSVKKAWNYCSTSKIPQARTFIHHWPGIIGVGIGSLITAWFQPKIAIIMAIAYYSHILLDHTPADKAVNLKKITIFGWILRISPFEIIFDLMCLFILSIILLN